MQTVDPDRLRQIAKRLLWWQPPDDTLEDPDRLIAQAMALGTWDDVAELMRVYGESRFRDVLAHAPPGVLDRRSWNYWHVRFGIDPIPPLPRRAA